jgi:TRAP-type uncharacterized transport system substrate-binding protein
MASRRTKALPFLLLAAAAAVLVLVAVWHFHQQKKPISITVSSGGQTGLRARMVQSLAANGQDHGLSITKVNILAVDETIGQLESRSVTFATLVGGFDLSGHPDLRQVAALNLEYLQLAVKEELYDAVSSNLQSLKGKRVQLGMTASGLAPALATELLTLAGLKVPTEQEPGDFLLVPPVPVARLVEVRRREHLPDALFLVSALPAQNLQHLVVEQRFRLVALPFARLFHLAALKDAGAVSSATPGDPLLKERIVDTVIPRAAYQLAPPVPPTDLATVGVRVLIVTHRDTDLVAVERLLEAIYSSRFVRLFNPPLTPSVEENVQELPWHDGAIRYARRGQPLITPALVSNLANTIQIAIPALTAVLCLWQWARQRARTQQEKRLESYLLQMLKLEGEAFALGPNLSPDEVLVAQKLQQELGRLKSEAILLYCKGGLSSPAHLTQLILQVNDVRSYLSQLLLRAASPAS